MINPQVKDIQISGIRQFFNLVAHYQDVVSLTLGQPDFPTPNHIKEAAKQAIDNNFTMYTPNAGTLELREAASTYVSKKYGLTYRAEDEVIVTVGASQAIDVAFRTILESGTDVLLPGPVYPGYEPIIRMCGANPIHIDTTNNEFRLTAELIAPHITEKTRCIVLPYPANPTGSNLTSEELNKIAELVRGKSIWILSDEIYSELIFSGSHDSIATRLREQTIVVNGLSKSHSMVGWRIGLLFAPKLITEQMLKVQQYSVSCASSISQKAAVEALTVGINDAEVMRKAYEERMEFAYKRLTEIGLDVVKPTASFYIFPSIKQFGLSSFEFAHRAVQEAGVAFVPGSAFSSYGEGYIRLSYACSLETLEEGLSRLKRFVDTL